MSNLLDQTPNLKNQALMKSRIQISIINRIDSYLNLLNRKPQPQFQINFELNKIVNPKHQEISKGKPKGVGYGDSNYQKFAFSSNQNSDVTKRQIEIQQNQQEINLETLLRCLRILIDQNYKNPKVVSCFQETLILNFLINFESKTIFQYFSVVTSIQNSKVFIEILRIIEILAQSSNTLELFLINDQQSLFKQLENFYQQAIMFIKTFNSKIDEINKFMEVYNYVETCLYAAKMITITYINKDCQNQNDEQISMHQFYNPFMKKLAVDKCEIQNDPIYLNVMKEYYYS